MAAGPPNRQRLARARSILPQLTPEVRSRILVAWGEDARGWLATAPALAPGKGRLWRLELGKPIVEGFDRLGPECRDRAGPPRILKLIPGSTGP